MDKIECSTAMEVGLETLMQEGIGYCIDPLLDALGSNLGEKLAAYLSSTPGKNTFAFKLMLSAEELHG